jgi:hypothetical protein
VTLEVSPMSTDSSHEIEINPEELIAAFFLAFCPVFLIVALFESLLRRPRRHRHPDQPGHRLTGRPDRSQEALGRSAP